MGNFRLVSVVIPAYNAASTIIETIDSVLKQSYDNIEIICVDDCSTDNTLDIISKHKQRNIKNRIGIRVVSLEVNSKTAAARNAGIKEAEGYYILPLDADDLIDPHYVEKAVDILSCNPRIGVVYSKARYIGESNDDWYSPPYCPTRIVKRNMVHCSGLYKKIDWEKYGGYDERLLYGLEDWDFWLKFVEDNRFFYRIPEVLFLCRVQNSSRSSFVKDKQQLRESLKIIRKSHARLIFIRKLKRLNAAKISKWIRSYF